MPDRRPQTRISLKERLTKGYAEKQALVGRGRAKTSMAYIWRAEMQRAILQSGWSGEFAPGAVDSMFAPSIHAGRESVRRKPFQALLDSGTSLPIDVLDRMDKDSRFAGIRAMSVSTFWTLLDASTLSLKETNELTEKSLERLGLTRMSSSAEERWLIKHRARYCSDFEVSSDLDDTDLSWASVDRVVDARPVSLDGLAVIGALYREAILGFHLEAAQALGARFWVLLEEFLSQRRLFAYIDPGFSSFVTSKVIYGRNDVDAMAPFQLDDKMRLPDHPIGILFEKGYLQDKAPASQVEWQEALHRIREQ